MEDLVMASAACQRPNINCADCRHRNGASFRDHSAAGLSLMTQLKHSHEVAWNQDVLIQQGQTEPLLFTLYSGMAIKCRQVSPGKSHLLSVVLPGELVGLDFAYGGVAWSSVQAVTDVTFCKFSPERWSDLLNAPGLAGRILENLVLDHRDLEDRLAVAGACAGEGALAYFLVKLYDRLRARRLCHDDSFGLPLTNRQIADAVGLTTVHLHRLLVKLRKKGVVSHEEHRIKIHDLSKLREIACLPARSVERALI